ncbi:MAG: hypothetical protein COT84_06685 [Chlamydiae bacterium CG10_big_fil_rev_8_21_14_0_10_35_9]|nr:MAG: hypothetical protein COT84_06685 [Chlamydiae bacterium CG10_big_fil_rev_8_21_14_0_10_35_9]
MGSMKAAIITAQGLGDGLIMMIIAYHLKKTGYQVTVFNKHLFSFYNWFPEYTFTSKFDIKKLPDFDVVILQHDNSPEANALAEWKKKNSLKDLYVLYTNYRFNKHGILDFTTDYPYNQSRTMVFNTVSAIKHFFPDINATNENGIQIPKHLTYQKYQKRILLHPTSGDAAKNWEPNSFLKLATLLKRKGFSPYFIISEKEKPHWQWVESKGFMLQAFSDLSNLASFIYESKALIGNDSGPSHLASNLKIPCLVIAKRRQNMLQWKPDFGPAKIIFPPRYMINLKFLRLKDYFWKKLIRPKKVFNNLILTINN